MDTKPLVKLNLNLTRPIKIESPKQAYDMVLSRILKIMKKAQEDLNVGRDPVSAQRTIFAVLERLHFSRMEGYRINIEMVCDTHMIYSIGEYRYTLGNCAEPQGHVMPVLNAVFELPLRPEEDTRMVLFGDAEPIDKKYLDFLFPTGYIIVPVKISTIADAPKPLNQTEVDIDFLED